MYSKSYATSHTHYQCRKCTCVNRLKKGRGLMAQQRPLQKFVPQAPQYGFTYTYENRYTLVSCPDLKKSLLAPCPKPNRKSAILNLSWRFCGFHAIFTGGTLTNSSQSDCRIRLKFAQRTQKTLTMKSYQKLEFS